MGKKLSRDDVRATGITACLIFGRHPVYPTMRASMVDPVSGIPNASLDCAEITKVDGGVMVRGSDSHFGRAGTVQVWWCVPLDARKMGTHKGPET